MIKHSERLDRITEYYFSKKLREVRCLMDQGQDIINLGIGSPDLKPPKSSLENLTKALNDKNANKYQSYNGIELFRTRLSFRIKRHIYKYYMTLVCCGLHLH